jgi:uncharacterized damage-inducible protein DinB
MKQNTIHAFDRLEIQRKDLISYYKSFSGKQLAFKPGPESWSMNQVLRHLVTAESQSLKLIKRKMNQVDQLPDLSIQVKARALLLKIALALPIKFKAPEIADVREETPVFEDLLSEWNAVRNEFREVMTQSDEKTFTKTIYQHPRAGYLTLKQAIEFMQDHISHHQKQIERIRRDKNFPVS